MSVAGESMSNDVHGSPAEENDEYRRFETLARKVVNTPKPTSVPAEPAGEPADGSAEPEREG
jgi:hypothetical protein